MDAFRLDQWSMLSAIWLAMLSANAVIQRERRFSPRSAGMACWALEAIAICACDPQRDQKKPTAHDHAVRDASSGASKSSFEWQRMNNRHTDDDAHSEDDKIPFGREIPEPVTRVIDDAEERRNT